MEVSKTAKSIRVSGWFLILAGLVLMLAPNRVMLFFWNDFVFEFWLRTLGYFMFVEGYLCYRASFQDWMEFYRWIMNIRLLQPLFFLALTISDYGNAGLMFYSTVEVIFGIWTFFVYKSEN